MIITHNAHLESGKEVKVTPLPTDPVRTDRGLWSGVGPSGIFCAQAGAGTCRAEAAGGALSQRSGGPGLQVGARVQVQMRKAHPPGPAVYGDRASGSPETLRAVLGAHR